MHSPSNEQHRLEKELLVCCARTRIDSGTTETIRRLVGGRLDWSLLLREAAENSVTPLLCRQLPGAAKDLLSSDRLDQLKGQSRTLAIRNLVLAGELVTLIDRFKSAGVEAIPYKGPVLAVQAYGDVALREFEDLDIVLRQRDISRANDVMLSVGYRSKLPGLLSDRAASIVPAEYAYFDDKRRIMVELHTERTLRHFPSPPDIDDLAARLTPVSIGGQHLFTFSPEDTLILLSVHGSKHFWERLSWTADVAEFIEANPIKWREVIVRAGKIRANRMLAINLLLARELFELSLPDEISRHVETDAAAASIATEIAGRLLGRNSRQPGGLARFQLRRQMLEGTLEGWRYSARLATSPSDEDWSAVRLPRFLAPFYVVLRPFRMATKYGLVESSSSGGSIADGKASN